MVFLVVVIMIVFGVSVALAGSGGLVDPIGPEPEPPCHTELMNTPTPTEVTPLAEIEAFLERLHRADDAQQPADCYGLYIVPDERPMWS